MNTNVRKAMLKSLGLNFLAGLVGLSPFLFLKKDDDLITWGFLLIGIAIVSLLTQLIIAIVYVSGSKRKEAGQGMLISVGIYLLIGLAVCSPMWL